MAVYGKMGLNSSKKTGLVFVDAFLTVEFVLSITVFPFWAIDDLIF
jgi:hypothetical protein